MSLASSIQQFKIRLETNPKLGVMLIVFIIALWVYGLFEILDWSDELEKERVDLQKKYDLAEDLSKETFWETRKNISQELLKTLETRLWPIQNEGPARASLEKEISQLAEKAGMERIRVTVDPKPAIDKNAPNYKRFTATIMVTGAKLNAIELFLDALAHEERLFILQSFELRVKPFPTFKISLSVIMPIGEDKKPIPTQVRKGAQK
ncbi:MAG: hypothetical protein Q8L85_10545 [Alphaproteobacteria bacterium]|nr:hypothetical protein [Alphaproteobacteria bacterium]